MNSFFHSKTLQQQMIFSHLLPVLVAVPILCVLAYFSLKTYRVINDTVETVAAMKVFISSGEAFTPGCEKDPVCAAKLHKHIRPQIAASVILLEDGKLTSFRGISDEGGEIRLERYTLAESFPQSIELLDVNASLPHGWKTDTDTNINLIAPIFKTDSSYRGMVRLTFARDFFSKILLESQWRMAAAVLSVALASIIIGSYLGIRFSGLLKNVTEIITATARGQHENVMPEIGSREIKDLAVAVNELNEQLHHSREYRHRLKSYLSHELGRPLGSLSSATDALAHGAAEDPELCRILTNGMKTEIKQLSFLIGQLRLSQDDCEEDAPVSKPRQKMDPVPLLREAAVYWREFAAAKELRFETELPDALPELALDRYAIQQMLGNLISNAVKFTPEGGYICLSAFAEKNAVRIELSDTGCGISEQDLPHVCDPYYRGGLSSVQPGMGLGLNIVKTVAEAHGGTFTLESTLGKGTKASILLPCKAP